MLSVRKGLTSNCQRFTLIFRMKLKLLFLLVLAAAVFLTPARAQTNLPATNSDAVVNGYLQIQEQLHAAQLALQEVRTAAADEAKQNADAIAARLDVLEQSVAAQRIADAEAVRRTQQLTLLLAGVFALAGLAIVSLLFYFQWRAFSQLTQISAQQHAAIANASAVHQLAAPGRATVESSNARLLDVVGQLERKIIELENGSSLLAEVTAGKSIDPLDEGQRLLDAGQPQKALAEFDRFLASHPDHAEGLVKKAAALEKLGRLPEALGFCDRAIARDGGFTLAFLQKGGLLNQLNRHDEALNCFEQVLLAQKKKGAFN
jgi:tetratricopeptide (TPR) repeat protein